jgi:hypothetical protein
MRNAASAGLIAIILGCLAFTGCSLNSALTFQNLLGEPLAVTAELSPEPIDPGARFEVRVKIENVSHADQTITVMGCSKEQNWCTDNPRIPLRMWRCFWNPTDEIKIAPGKTYENTIALDPNPDARAEEAVRLGFHSLGSKRTYWSNRIVVRTK